ncbi:hypothetical protein N0V90_013379, partial [Kalmusia sp. IMI 367209]
MNVNPPTITGEAVSIPARLTLPRRTDYAKTCAFIGPCREERFANIPIHHLIPVAFHMTPQLLKNVPLTAGVMQAILEQYAQDDSDLFSDWQSYCRAIDMPERIAATFEGATYFAVNSLEKSKEGLAWVYTCTDQLHTLKRLMAMETGDVPASTTTEGDDPSASTLTTGDPQASTAVRRTRRRRANSSAPARITGLSPRPNIGRRGRPRRANVPTRTAVNTAPETANPPDVLPQQPLPAATVDASAMAVDFVAVPPAQGYFAPIITVPPVLPAEVAGLEDVVGPFLFAGIRESYLRRAETCTTPPAFSWYSGTGYGADFQLEIWVDVATGNRVSQAASELGDALEGVLGKWLYLAMESSIWRMAEKRQDSRFRAVQVTSLEGSSDDAKVALV